MSNNKPQMSCWLVSSNCTHGSMHGARLHKTSRRYAMARDPRRDLLSRDRDTFLRNRDQIRDASVRDRDETETFRILSETRPRPHPCIIVPKCTQTLSFSYQTWEGDTIFFPDLSFSPPFRHPLTHPVVKCPRPRLHPDVGYATARTVIEDPIAARLRGTITS